MTTRKRSALVYLMLAFLGCNITSGLTMKVYGEQEQNLMNLTIEELLNLEIISVTRGKGQSVKKSPAAIFVVTAEDIKRVGATSIVEALRLVPGLHVTRIDAARWAVSSRGGTTRWYSYMLVQVDGRTVYSPVFSGVLWEAQDLPLEDIERIEVIRGPGAALWGANAVNGVINIVTKEAKDTRGALVSASVGTEEPFIGSFRYGTGIDELLDFRLYGKYRFHDDFETYGTDYSDDWEGASTCIRVDFYPWDDDVISVDAGFHHGEYGTFAQFPDLDQGMMVTGGADLIEEDWHALTRWNHSFSETSELQAQVYYDWMTYKTDPHIPYEDQGVRHGTTDVDIQHSVQLGDRNRLVYGLGYRYVSMNLNNSSGVAFRNQDLDLETFSGFVQDTLAIIPDQLSLSLGSKVEKNDLTDFEYQPTARAAWTPHEDHTIWASWSRAVRVPSIVERDVTIAMDIFQLVIPNPTPFGPRSFVIPIEIDLMGNEDLDAVVVHAYEVGYRTALTEDLSVDVAGYFNHYENPIVLEIAMMNGMPAGFQFMNGDSSDTYGVEVSTTWQALDCWRLTGAYTFADGDDGGAMATFPHNQASLTSQVNITEDIDLNTTCYYYDEVMSNARGVVTPDYVRLDAGITWRPCDKLELSLWGQNLLENTHPELRPEFSTTAGASEVERGVYTMATFRF